MTIGRLLFSSGIGLLAPTILTAIVFLLKRPKYIPENATYEHTESNRTQKRKVGAPFEPGDVRQELPSTQLLSPTEFAGTKKLEGETAAFFQTGTPVEKPLLHQTEKTDLLPPTEKIDL